MKLLVISYWLSGGENPEPGWESLILGGEAGGVFAVVKVSATGMSLLRWEGGRP